MATKNCEWNVIAIMPKFGTVEAFNINGKEKITEYFERLDEYYCANDIDEERKKKAILLTAIGSEAYSLLRNLVFPAKPNTKDYATLKNTLTDHYSPTPICIAERYKFYSRNQEPHESLHEYIAELRNLTEHCKFENFLSEALKRSFCMWIT